MNAITTDLPAYVSITFWGALVFVVVQFYRASNYNWKLISGILLWGLMQSILVFGEFYENTRTVPPRFVFLIFPAIVIIFSSIFSQQMRNWLASLNLKQLTFLHMVRIPVELTLFWLFAAGLVPELMTFEGRNFDILAGITAPVVAMLAFKTDKLNKVLLWVWNLASIMLLTNILVNAVLSTPTVLQQFAFDQPNIAVFKFPFVLLPGIIVPLVLIANIAGFVQLTKKG